MSLLALRPAFTSLMPSSRITYRSAWRLSTSRSRRCRALRPLLALSPSTLLPLIDSSTTEYVGPPGWAINRSARKSGQRWLALSVDAAPSVIESPKAAIVPRAVLDRTLTASTKNQWVMVVVYAAAPASDVWFPAVDT